MGDELKFLPNCLADPPGSNLKDPGTRQGRQQRGMCGAEHLVRMDSAFYGRGPVHAALSGGAAVSVTVRMDKRVKAAITTIGDDAWTTIEYTDAVFDEASQRWISGPRSPRSTSPRSPHRRRPTPSRAGSWSDGSRTSTPRRIRPLPGHPVRHLAVPRVLHHLRPRRAGYRRRGQDPCGHAVIEQVHADLKGAVLAHLPSGVFTANAAWLVLAVIAFNLTRAAASLTDPQLTKATTATIRRKLITVPARVATSARRVTLHLPQAWPWETAWTALFDRVSDPPSYLAA